MSKTLSETEDDALAVSSAIHGIRADMHYAYKNGNSTEVTKHLLDALEENMPEDELTYIAEYLNDRYSHDSS